MILDCASSLGSGGHKVSHYTLRTGFELQGRSMFFFQPLRRGYLIKANVELCCYDTLCQLSLVHNIVQKVCFNVRRTPQFTENWVIPASSFDVFFDVLH